MEVIPSVFASGNNKMKDEIAARLVSTGLPVLTTIGEVLQKTKLIDPQNRSTIFDLTDPREIARYKALFGIEPPSNFVGSVNVMWNTNEDGQPIPRDHKPLKENLSTSKPIYKDFVDEATGKNHTWLMNDDGTKGKDLGPSKVSIAGSGRYQASPEDIKLIAAGVRAIPPRVTIDKLTRDTRAQVIAEVEKQNQMEGKPGYTNYMADIADVKAGTSALQFSTKMTDMTRSFISTMDSNISMLEKHIEEFSKRHNMDRAKILNMGTRAFNMKVMGDADFSIYDMLISSISTENAKLQLGGAGSVAQVAEGARIKMDEIHNKDMPVSEMLKLLNATRTEGNNRATALQKEVDKRRNKLRVGDTDAINPPAGTVADGKTGSIKKEDMATIEFKTKAKAALQADNFPNKAEFDFNGITMVAVKTKTGYDFYPKKDGPPR
jgi:hypothetical protein